MKRIPDGLLGHRAGTDYWSRWNGTRKSLRLVLRGKSRAYAQAFLDAMRHQEMLDEAFY